MNHSFEPAENTMENKLKVRLISINKKDKLTHSTPGLALDQIYTPGHLVCTLISSMSASKCVPFIQQSKVHCAWFALALTVRPQLSGISPQ